MNAAAKAIAAKRRALNETTTMHTTTPAVYTSTQDDLGCSKLHVSVAGRAYETAVSDRNPGPQPDARHPWERAGLGVAPYKLVGAGEMIYQAAPGAPVQPGAACDYCGQGIRQVYFIRAACGSTFHVGCDCVRKTCDPAEGVRTAIEAADRKHRNQLARAARTRRDEQVQADLAALREQHAQRLAKMPHPCRGRWVGNTNFDDKSALDWLDWMLRACGASGRAKLLAEVRDMLALDA